MEHDRPALTRIYLESTEVLRGVNSLSPEELEVGEALRESRAHHFIVTFAHIKGLDRTTADDLTAEVHDSNITRRYKYTRRSKASDDSGGKT